MADAEAITDLPACAAAPAAGWWRKRAVPALLLAATGMVIAAAWWLHPDATGVGTHTQLGLPPCGLYETTGLPCATCGMTTAFSHAAHGRLLAAVITQPAGALFALLDAALVLTSGYALVTGLSLAPLGRWMWRPKMVLGFGVLVLLAWLYKIAVLQMGA